jgi:hypothetical protein
MSRQGTNHDGHSHFGSPVDDEQEGDDNAHDNAGFHIPNERESERQQHQSEIRPRFHSKTEAG